MSALQFPSIVIHQNQLHNSIMAASGDVSAIHIQWVENNHPFQNVLTLLLRCLRKATWFQLYSVNATYNFQVKYMTCAPQMLVWEGCEERPLLQKGHVKSRLSFLKLKGGKTVISQMRLKEHHTCSKAWLWQYCILL